jgi:hypothetical protein
MDVYIRRLAGLSAASAIGDIRITDVGHHPSDTMISIVAKRTDSGWQVSYACAGSPQCGDGTDHSARSYTLKKPASDDVDALLQTLRGVAEQDNQLPSTSFIGGRLSVLIDYNGFKRDYRRAGRQIEPPLGKLESLLSPPVLPPSS